MNNTGCQEFELKRRVLGLCAAESYSLMATKYFTSVNCQVTAVVQRARRQEVSLTSCCQGTKIKNKQTNMNHPTLDTKQNKYSPRS